MYIDVHKITARFICLRKIPTLSSREIIKELKLFILFFGMNIGYTNTSVFVVDFYDRDFGCLCSYILCHLIQIMLE